MYGTILSGLQHADNYNEATLIDDARPPPGEAESAPAAAAQALELTVEGVTSLNVARLKEELKRRGRSIAGKKGDLQARLKEAIVLNKPVASGGGESTGHSEGSGPQGGQHVFRFGRSIVL